MFWIEGKVIFLKTGYISIIYIYIYILTVKHIFRISKALETFGPSPNIGSL